MNIWVKAALWGTGAVVCTVGGAYCLQKLKHEGPTLVEEGGKVVSQLFSGGATAAGAIADTASTTVSEAQQNIDELTQLGLS